MDYWLPCCCCQKVPDSSASACWCGTYLALCLRSLPALRADIPVQPAKVRCVPHFGGLLLPWQLPLCSELLMLG